MQKWTKKNNFVLETDIWVVDNGIIEKFLPKQEKGGMIIDNKIAGVYLRVSTQTRQSEKN